MKLHAMKAVLDNLIGYIATNEHAVGWRERYICANAVQIEYIPTRNALEIVAISPDGELMFVKYSADRRFFN